MITTIERSPIENLTDLLRSYFDTQRIGAVSDPWARIMDGFLLRVHICRWPGRVSLSADDFGLDGAEYAQLNGKVKWGALDLLPDEIGPAFESIATLARQLPRKWGREVHWGLFVPLSAMGKLREEWEGLEARWNAALDAWVLAYEQHRVAARERAAAFAAQSWRVAHRVQHARLSNEQYAKLDTFVDAMVPRLMADYPEPATIRARFTMAYDLAFIPTPTLEAEQAASAEQVVEANAQRLAEMRREAEIRAYQDELERLRAIEAISAEELKQQEKLKLVRAFAEETRQKLQQEQARLLHDFYRSYALDIRQRLHESLMLLVEGVQTGQIRPQASRSLRVVLDEITHLALDDDTEIQQMHARLRTLIGQAGEKISAAAIRQEVEDFGILLQTSILALGETPRTPKRMHVAPLDVVQELPSAADLFAQEISARRTRLGLSSSLAEALIGQGGLTPADLRRRARAAQL